VAIALDNALSYRRIEELNSRLAEEKVYLEDEIAPTAALRKSSARAARSSQSEAGGDGGADRFHGIDCGETGTARNCWRGQSII